MGIDRSNEIFRHYGLGVSNMRREAFFDNAKFVLIFLVVFGHLIQPFTDTKGIEVLYHFIYLFHMPAFILLSGFFAKGIGKVGYIWQMFRKLIIPYLLFQLLYSGYYYLIGDPGWETTWYEPHWALWFLLSLFCWHVLLILFKQVPPLISITTALIIGVGIGYINDVGHAFSLSRTFVFFPFFVLGYWLSKQHLLQLTQPVFKWSSLIIVSTVIVLLSISPTQSIDWLLGSFSYQEMGQPIWGGVIRFGVYLLALLLTCCILAWIPRKTYNWTARGKQTLYVYLLHGVFIQFFREAGWFKIDNLVDVMGLALLALLIVLLLSSKMICVPFQPLIEGKVTQIKQWHYERRRKKRIYLH